MMILNLTQHDPLPGQIKAGVINLLDAERVLLHRILNFEQLPTPTEITARAETIAELAALYDINGDDHIEGRHATQAMIGGAPFLMAPLEAELRARGIEPLYAFAPRVSEEQIQPDGSVKKVNVFRHMGFVSTY